MSIDGRMYAENRSYDEVKDLLHYAHFIPRKEGITARYVDTNWPGHTFDDLLAVLKAAGVVTFVSPLGALVTADAGVVRQANNLKPFRRLLFNDATDWAVEWPDGSSTRSATSEASGGETCQSTVEFDDYPCTSSPRWIVRLEVLGYGVAHPGWRGSMCQGCWDGWQAWAREEPQNIRLVSALPIATG